MILIEGLHENSSWLPRVVLYFAMSPDAPYDPAAHTKNQQGLPAKKDRNLPMKTPNGVTAAFILASAVLAAPAAFAEGPWDTTVQARFAFDPNEPAVEIYSDLTRTARRACELNGTRTLNVTKHEQACMKEMIQDGVTKLGRSDVAAVHNGYFATANAGTRG